MPKKSVLYDKPRYAFDEEDLFSHAHKPSEETKTFPWWKPFWHEEMGCWCLLNPSGEMFNWFQFNMEPDLFPEHLTNHIDGSLYKHVPTFYIEWTKKRVYYRSIMVWNAKEKEFTKEFPNKRPDQIARLCDEEVAKFFQELKVGIPHTMTAEETGRFFEKLPQR